MEKAYKFTMVPEVTQEVVQYFLVKGEAAKDIEEVIYEDPDEYFGELDNGRHPGYVLQEWEEVLPDEARANDPYTLS
jgi:hypothetical protein